MKNDAQERVIPTKMFSPIIKIPRNRKKNKELLASASKPVPNVK
jgi:hypothetical protein